MQIAIPAILAAFIILFLHWFPWHLLRGEKVGRLTAYTLGTVVIVGVASTPTSTSGCWTVSARFGAMRSGWKR